MLFVMVSVFPSAAFAHTRYELPPYSFVVGWMTEPPVVDGDNAVYVEIFVDDDEPFVGAEQTLDAQLQYAGKEYTTNLLSTDEPGVYHSDTFIPTARGTLDVLLIGELEGETIEVVGELEEVVSAGQLQFPERLPSQFEQVTQLDDLKTQVDDLSGQLSSARLFGLIGTVLGVLGLGLGGFSLFKRK